jgi:hypothetical protein
MGGNEPPPLPGGRPFSPASAFNGNRHRPRGGSSGSSGSDVIHVRKTPSAPVISNSFQALTSSQQIDDADMLDAFDQFQSRIRSPGIAILDSSPHAQPRPSLPATGFDFEGAFETIVKQRGEFTAESKSTLK